MYGDTHQIFARSFLSNPLWPNTSSAVCPLMNPVPWTSQARKIWSYCFFSALLRAHGTFGAALPRCAWLCCWKFCWSDMPPSWADGNCGAPAGLYGIVVFTGMNVVDIICSRGSTKPVICGTSGRKPPAPAYPVGCACSGDAAPKRPVGCTPRKPLFGWPTFC